MDVVILGAGAAGLMCAIEAAKRQRQVLILDHANKVGKKILMSGGGRCNFTNYYIEPEKFLSNNPHFCKSALSRYTQWDFINLVEQYNIAYHEKTLGQLFCDNKSKDIVEMLLSECNKYSVQIKLNHKIQTIKKLDVGFEVSVAEKKYQCQSLVIATGGLSIPTMGASPFGYKVAEQFGIGVMPTRAALVPFTLHVADKERLSQLSGVSVFCTVSNHRASFSENILFTHRGISGPAALQMSSYWYPGETLTINLLPQHDVADILNQAKKNHSQKMIKTLLAELIPQRVIETFVNESIYQKTAADISNEAIANIAQALHQWQLQPNATEGYRTAEVTIGGVDTNALSSKTMEASDVPGLYFIGEVVDVAGWLGGYNFQWAWSSGWAAGQVV